MDTAALGRSWSDDELRVCLDTAKVPYEHCDDLEPVLASASCALRVRLRPLFNRR
jgi:hypothetical protein